MSLLAKYKKQQIHILGATKKIEELQAEIKKHEHILDYIYADAVTYSELIAEALENAGINGFYVLNAPAHIIPVAGLIRREVMIDGITVIVCLDLDTSELLINNQPVNSFEVLA
jgi:hypothetical protein